MPWAEYALSPLRHSVTTLNLLQCMLGFKPSHLPSISNITGVQVVGQSLTLSLRLKPECKKHNMCYIGSFKVIKQVNPVSYLEIWPQYHINPTCHVSPLNLLLRVPKMKKVLLLCPWASGHWRAYIIKDIFCSHRGGHTLCTGRVMALKSWAQAKEGHPRSSP